MPTCHKPQRPAVVVRRCSLNPRTPETTDSLNANSWNNLGTLQAVTRPYPPARDRRPDIVGNDNDGSAEARATYPRPSGRSTE